MSLNKDKLLELDLLPRSYDVLPIQISNNNTQTSMAVGNDIMENIYAFKNVHHIYDQVYFVLLLFLF